MFSNHAQNHGTYYHEISPEQYRIQYVVNREPESLIALLKLRQLEQHRIQRGLHDVPFEFHQYVLFHYFHQGTVKTWHQLLPYFELIVR